MKEYEIRPKALFDQMLAYVKDDAARLAARRDEFVSVSCPGCGSGESDPSFDKDGFTYRECRSCGSLFTSPRPDAAALSEYLSTSRAVEFWSTHFYRQTAEARREQIFRPRAQMIAELVRARIGERAGSLVDVGAGYGLLLQEIRATGAFANLAGIEPDGRLAAICRQEGFAVVEKPIEAVAEGEVQADVATAFEVLEHTFEPAAFIGACARVVRPGGLLLFTTLTISGFDLQTLWQHSRQIAPPQHLNFLSVQGICELVRRAGLEIVELSTPGMLDVDIVRNACAEQPELELSRFARTLVASSEETRSAFQRFLQANRLSSHVRCVARKP